MCDKFLKKLAEMHAALVNSTAAVQSTELVIILFLFIVITLAVVAGIWKMLGDGESNDKSEGGLLGYSKRMFDSKQN